MNEALLIHHHRKQHPMPYTYRADKDGTDETLDIISPMGEHLASVPYWDGREKAEAVASRVADLFNSIYPSNTAT